MQAQLFSGNATTAVSGIVVAMLWWLVPAVKEYALGRLEFSLKRDMVARGMSAEEIARVIHTTKSTIPPVDSVSLPCASQVVVHADDEWKEALVLRASDGRYFVHYVGTDMSENEWIEQDRVRFPADTSLAPLAAHADFAPTNGAPVKAPMLAEV